MPSGRPAGSKNKDQGDKKRKRETEEVDTPQPARGRGRPRKQLGTTTAIINSTVEQAPSSSQSAKRKKVSKKQLAAHPQANEKLSKKSSKSTKKSKKSKKRTNDAGTESDIDEKAMESVVKLKYQKQPTTRPATKSAPSSYIQMQPHKQRGDARRNGIEVNLDHVDEGSEAFNKSDEVESEDEQNEIEEEHEVEEGHRGEEEHEVDEDDRRDEQHEGEEEYEADDQHEGEDVPVERTIQEEIVPNDGHGDLIATQSIHEEAEDQVEAQAQEVRSMGNKKKKDIYTYYSDEHQDHRENELKPFRKPVRKLSMTPSKRSTGSRKESRIIPSRPTNTRVPSPGPFLPPIKDDSLQEAQYRFSEAMHSWKQEVGRCTQIKNIDEYTEAITQEYHDVVVSLHRVADLLDTKNTYKYVNQYHRDGFKRIDFKDIRLGNERDDPYARFDRDDPAIQRLFKNKKEKLAHAKILVKALERIRSARDKLNEPEAMVEDLWVFFDNFDAKLATQEDYIKALLIHDRDFQEKYSRQREGDTQPRYSRHRGPTHMIPRDRTTPQHIYSSRDYIDDEEEEDEEPEPSRTDIPHNTPWVLRYDGEEEHGRPNGVSHTYHKTHRASQVHARTYSDRSQSPAEKLLTNQEEPGKLPELILHKIQASGRSVDLNEAWTSEEDLAVISGLRNFSKKFPIEDDEMKTVMYKWIKNKKPQLAKRSENDVKLKAEQKKVEFSAGGSVPGLRWDYVEDLPHHILELVEALDFANTID